MREVCTTTKERKNAAIQRKLAQKVYETIENHVKWMIKSASGTDSAFENFRVRSLSCSCETAAMFSAI